MELTRTGTSEEGIPQHHHTGKYITGYYGCSCHPFATWAHCERYHKQRFQLGDLVRTRCTGKRGTVIEATDKTGFCIVKFGNQRCEEVLKHSAELERTTEQLTIF